MINILPINDIDEHIENPKCKCKPEIRIEYGLMMVIHNSFDGRKGIEMAQEHLDNQLVDDMKEFNEAWNDFVMAFCGPFIKLGNWITNKLKL